MGRELRAEGRRDGRERREKKEIGKQKEK